ncbi:response regulator [Geminicoccus harenae]|uniref:response regulator n=1 Tax=Geminicoccus harenae TaxID=2498453 RepID=UPI00168BF0D7|nr:response regulator [Geminicoccus harenae]
MRTTGRSTWLEGARVFIADDEVLIAFDLEATFQSVGAQVVGPWFTLPEALASAQRDHIDVAVLDFRLGTETTEPVAHLLMKRQIPFLFYSGQRLPELLSCRGHVLVEKPAMNDCLVQAVARLMPSP